MVESQLHVKQSCLPSLISKWNVTNSKNELLKTVRLTTFPKQQLHSISIFSMFVHLCLLLHYAVLFIPSFIVLCGYLCFAQFGGVLPLFEFWWISWYSSFNSLCLLHSKHPHIRTHDFRVQADLVLIYWVLSEKLVRCS